MSEIQDIVARHVEATQYRAVSGDRCACRVGMEPGYDGHSHTDVVQACEECSQLWPCDARVLADALADVTENRDSVLTANGALAAALAKCQSGNREIARAHAAAQRKLKTSGLWTTTGGPTTDATLEQKRKSE